MFVLESKIEIGNYHFSGVHDVVIQRSVRGFVDRATIVLPSVCKVKRGQAIEGPLALGLVLEEGDYVKIELGYNGVLRLEFEGFVSRMGMQRPMVIECEGYSWQMRNNVTVNGFCGKAKVSELIALATGRADLKNQKIVALPQAQWKTNIDYEVASGDDIELHFIQFVQANGVQILSKVTELTLGSVVAFFSARRKLWVGMPYTAYKAGADVAGNNEVKYRVGWNVLEPTQLRQRIPAQPVQVIVGTITPAGKKVFSLSEYQYAKRKDKTVYNYMQDKGNMQQVANEREYRMNYQGFEGSFTGFLEPYCAPGWKVDLTASKEYTALNGKYLCEATTVSFGMGGARRVVALGPKVGFANKV